jgi:phage baseplate assembly protein V
MKLMPGIAIGVVQDVDHPDGEGAIRVRYPWLDGRSISKWAPIAAPMAGHDRGFWMVPEVGDECVLGFDRGDRDSPYVLGFLWNGEDKPPSTAVRERLIRSKNGHTIRFIDSTPDAGGNKGALSLEDASGNRIVMTNGKVTIKSKGTLILDAPTVVIGETTYRRVVTPNRNPI